MQRHDFQEQREAFLEAQLDSKVSAKDVRQLNREYTQAYYDKNHGGITIMIRKTHASAGLLKIDIRIALKKDKDTIKRLKKRDKAADDGSFQAHEEKTYQYLSLEDGQILLLKKAIKRLEIPEEIDAAFIKTICDEIDILIRTHSFLETFCGRKLIPAENKVGAVIFDRNGNVYELDKFKNDDEILRFIDNLKTPKVAAPSQLSFLRPKPGFFATVAYPESIQTSPSPSIAKPSGDAMSPTPGNDSPSLVEERDKPRQPK